MNNKVNLSLAAAGDVAVLRNETQKEIKKLLIPQTFSSYCFIIKYDLGIRGFDSYTKDGFIEGNNRANDIIDVTRNGTSIFND